MILIMKNYNTYLLVFQNIKRLELDTKKKKERFRKRTNTCAPVNPKAAMGTRTRGARRAERVLYAMWSLMHVLRPVNISAPLWRMLNAK